MKKRKIYPFMIALLATFFVIPMCGVQPVKAAETNVLQGRIKQVSAGGHHTMILMADGTLWACGNNNYGQLGDGTTTNCSTPKKVMNDVSAVSAGLYHTMIVMTDGSLWACGWNLSGQLGDGSTTNRSVPKKVMTGVAAVSAGCEHTLILKTDGSLWGCGNNGCGQLSDGTTTNRSTPKQVMTNVKAVSAGGYSTMIVKTNGSLWACGNNGSGQLGDGTNTNCSTLKQVMTGVSVVSSGGAHTMIVKTDGSLWACGSNDFGQLGDRTTTNCSAPKQVMNGVVTVSASGIVESYPSTTMIVKTDGSLLACGNNKYGQLGDETNINRDTPVQVMTGVSAVDAGYSHTLIIKTDGSLWACGNNDYGQLGDGTNVNRYKPVMIVEAPTNILVTSIILNKTSLSLEEGQETTLTATIRPDNATDKSVTWTSSNTSVATVSNTGKVTAKTKGNATITCKANDGSGVLVTCAVTVTKAPEPETGEDTDISQLDNIVYLEKTEGHTDSELTLSLRMKNTAPIRAFQFDLYLPEGVTAVKNAKGRILASLSDERRPEDDEHTLTVSEQPDGAIRFLCGSQYDETFTGNEGEIATLKVNIAVIADGDYPIILRDMKLTETDISKFYVTSYIKSTLTVSSYMIGDINGDDKVDVSDYTGIANHILGNTPEEFVVKAADVNEDGAIDVSDYTGVANIILTGSIYGNAGSRVGGSMRTNTDISTMDNVLYIEPFTADTNTELTLSVKMKNTAPIRSFQFDLYLPECLTALKNAKGRFLASLSSDRLPEDDEHTLSVAEQSDGAIRFLCGSQYDETFTGNSGEVITLKVKLAEEVGTGSYPIFLRNMKLSETDIRFFYETELVESSVTIIPTGIKETTVDSKYSDTVYSLSGQRLSAPKKGINIVNGKKVVVK